MRFASALLGIGLLLLALLLAGILWRESERQYLAMSDLALRLKALQRSAPPAGATAPAPQGLALPVLKPMLVAMRQEAHQGARMERGWHLSEAAHQQLSRFGAQAMGEDADPWKWLARLDLSDEVLAARAPLIFSTHEQEAAQSALTQFQAEATALLAGEAVYAEWLGPILRQQRLLDRSTTCKTLSELKAFQVYAERLKSKCASHKDKWAACGAKDEPIARQMQELQLTLDSNLRKFKSRWPLDNVDTLCSDN